MTVGGRGSRIGVGADEAIQIDGTEEEKVGMRNHWIISLLAVLIWLVIVVMNVALLVFVGLGLD